MTNNNSNINDINQLSEMINYDLDVNEIKDLEDVKFVFKMLGLSISEALYKSQIQINPQSKIKRLFK